MYFHRVQRTFRELIEFIIILRTMYAMMIFPIGQWLWHSEQHTHTSLCLSKRSTTEIIVLNNRKLYSLITVELEWRRWAVYVRLEDTNIGTHSGNFLNNTWFEQSSRIRVQYMKWAYLPYCLFNPI